MKLLNKSIDYSNLTIQEKDQFFTPKEGVDFCFDKFKIIMNNYKIDYTKHTFIEPSAGDGAFLNVLPKNTISMDIEPKKENIQQQDYLNYIPPKGKYIVFGNPPFGLRGHLALKFINHSQFADFICFVLPPLFNSDGKGVPRKRVKNFNLIYSIDIPVNNFYYPNKNEVKVNAIFQIWSKNIINDKYIINKQINTDFKIYSVSDGGTSSSTRNKKMLNKCDRYLPSTCFGIENVKIYYDFEELPNRRGYGIVFNNKNLIEKFDNIEWDKIAFLSTNSAYNLRMSKIEDCLKKMMLLELKKK